MFLLNIYLVYAYIPRESLQEEKFSKQNKCL